MKGFCCWAVALVVIQLFCAVHSNNYYGGSETQQQPQPQAQPSQGDQWWLKNNAFQKPANHPGVERGDGQSGAQAPQAQAPPQYSNRPATSPGGGWGQPEQAPAAPTYQNVGSQIPESPDCLLRNKADCHPANTPQTGINYQQQQSVPSYPDSGSISQSYKPPSNVIVPDQGYSPPKYSDFYASKPAVPPHGPTPPPLPYQAGSQPKPADSYYQTSSGQYDPKPYTNFNQNPPPKPYSNPNPIQPVPGNNNFEEPPPSPLCPAAMLCVKEEFCNASGVNVETPVVLSAAEKLYRVALSSCSFPGTGEVGVCCRDPNYKDPWPDMNGGGHEHHPKSAGGHNDGQYNPSGHNNGQYQPNHNAQHNHGQYQSAGLSSANQQQQPKPNIPASPPANELSTITRNERSPYNSCAPDEECIETIRCMTAQTNSSSESIRCKPDLGSSSYTCCKKLENVQIDVLSTTESESMTTSLPTAELDEEFTMPTTVINDIEYSPKPTVDPSQNTLVTGSDPLFHLRNFQPKLINLNPYHDSERPFRLITLRIQHDSSVTDAPLDTSTETAPTTLLTPTETTVSQENINDAERNSTEFQIGQNHIEPTASATEISFHTQRQTEQTLLVVAPTQAEIETTTQLPENISVSQHPGVVTGVPEKLEVTLQNQKTSTEIPILSTVETEIEDFPTSVQMDSSQKQTDATQNTTPKLESQTKESWFILTTQPSDITTSSDLLQETDTNFTQMSTIAHPAISSSTLKPEKLADSVAVKQFKYFIFQENKLPRQFYQPPRLSFEGEGISMQNPVGATEANTNSPPEYQNVSISATNPTQESGGVISDSCGISEESPHSNSKLPWHVLLRAGELHCEGVILNSRVIATTASCANNFADNQLEVLVGGYDSDSSSDGIMNMEIGAVIKHPKFKSGNLSYNLALIFTPSDKSISFDHRTGPICLPSPSENFDGMHCLTTRSEFTGLGNYGPNRGLNKLVEIAVNSSEACEKRIQELCPRFQLEKSTFCGGGLSTCSTCYDQDGTSLVCRNANSQRYFLAGLTMKIGKDFGCRDLTELPPTFTNVLPLTEWMSNFLSRNPDDVIDEQKRLLARLQ